GHPTYRPQPADIFEVVGRELSQSGDSLKRRSADVAPEEGDFLKVDEVLKERASQTLGHISTLLGLVLPPQSVRLAFRALHTDDAKLRGVALEYLDSVLPKTLRQQISSQLEGPAPVRSASAAASREEALANLQDASPSIIARLEDLGFNQEERKPP